MMLLLFLAAVSATAGASADACLAVQSDRITAGDLTPAWPQLAGLPASTPLGYSPVPGARRVFRSAELQRVAARYGVPAPRILQLCVERPTRRLLPEEVRAAMQRVLPAAKIEILECSRYPVPDGSLDFPLNGITHSRNSAQPGSVLWRGFVRYGENRQFPVWARGRVTVRVSKVMAVQPLRAGKPIAAGQVRLEAQEGLPEASEAPLRLEDVVGRIPLRNLAAGSAVSAALLVEAPAVQRGEIVEVVAESGSARVILTAEAMADGRHGQSIPVRNPHSGKRFAALVEAPGKVSVKEKGIPR